MNRLLLLILLLMTQSVSVSANIAPPAAADNLTYYSQECWARIDYVRVNNQYYSEGHAKIPREYNNRCLIECNNIDAMEFRMKMYVDHRQCECRVANSKCQAKAKARHAKRRASDRAGAEKETL